VEFPTELLRRAEEAAQQLQTNRSQLIRNSVQEYVLRLERKRFEEELAEGYRQDAELNRRLCAEFAYVDAENF
jgi:metal-responsive CopG/Arc/MetJ family transcriptional regulator